MPQYDYQSDDGQIVTITRSIKADPIHEIEHEGKVYRRIFNLQPIIFAAMGFYSTDNLDPIEKWRKENMRGM